MSRPDHPFESLVSEERSKTSGRGDITVTWFESLVSEERSKTLKMDGM